MISRLSSALLLKYLTSNIAGTIWHSEQRTLPSCSAKVQITTDRIIAFSLNSI